MVRKAKMGDMPDLLRIYDAARVFMAEHGNPTQWGDGYPIPEQLEEDIRRDRLYVVCDRQDIPHGAFAYILGEEPAYEAIDGAWPNDRPYGTIHRLAGDGTMPGIFAQCLDFCTEICPNIRADTHLNNLPMRHLLEKHGFVRCGMVNLELHEGDTLRIAYQREG